MTFLRQTRLNDFNNKSTSFSLSIQHSADPFLDVSRLGYLSTLLFPAPSTGEACCSGAALHESKSAMEQDAPRPGGETEVSGAAGTQTCEPEGDTDAATAPPDTLHDALLSKGATALQDLGGGVCEASQTEEVTRREKTVVFVSLKTENGVEKPSHPSPAQDVTMEQVERFGEQDGAARTRARIATAGVSPDEEPTDRTCLLEHRC